MTASPQADLPALYKLYADFEHGRYGQPPRQYAAYQFDPSLIDVMTRAEFGAYFRRLSPMAQEFQIARWRAGFKQAQRDDSCSATSCQ